MIDQRAVTSAASLVDDAQARGARLLTGGRALAGPGTFYAPTVLGEVPPDAQMRRREIFGPVLGVATFDDDDDAIRQANDTEFGLVGYAFTRDLDRAHRLIAELETGMLGINSGLVSNAAAPFGGVKQSGVGREGGAEGIAEYLETSYALIAG
jgi:succinate-semialdehyde dehydrogenase/glutarate-semialdehyde dehydrogenase